MTAACDLWTLCTVPQWPSLYSASTASVLRPQDTTLPRSEATRNLGISSCRYIYMLTEWRMEIYIDIDISALCKVLTCGARWGRSRGRWRRVSAAPRRAPC